MSTFDWWSEWRTVRISFSKDVVTSSDTCNATVTAVACPCQVLFVPANYSCTRRGLLAIIVRQTCTVSSFAITGRRTVQGSVSQLLLWSVVLPGSLRLACDSRPETLVSSLVQRDCWLIGLKSLMVKCSTKGLIRPSFKEDCSDGAASLVQVAPQKGFHMTPITVTCRHLISLRNSWLTSAPQACSTCRPRRQLEHVPRPFRFPTSAALWYSCL